MIKMAAALAVGLLAEAVYVAVNAIGKLDMDYSVVGLLAGTILLIIGWMSGNHIANEYRRESRNFGGSLPIEVLDRKLQARSPFIAAGLITVLVSCLAQLINILIG